MQAENLAQRHVFDVRSCREIFEIVPESRAEPVYAPIEMPVIPIEYGAREHPHGKISEHPVGGWQPYQMRWPELFSYSFQNSVVYGEEGIIVVENRYVVEECLRLCNFQGEGVRWESPRRISIPIFSPAIHVVAGLSLVSGWPGNRNYAHWIVDVLPGCHPPFVNNDAVIIWPKQRAKYHKESIDLLSKKERNIFLEPNGAVSCERVYVNPAILSNPGHYPHPGRLQMVQTLKSIVKPCSIDRRKIFISRKDAASRVLIEENEIINRMQQRGYEIHTLSGKSFQEQIRLFSEAYIVVGAHGAGMSNIMFCNSDSFFLEIFYENYVQWSMRRLASLSRLRYGCIIGCETSGSDGPLAKTWSIDPDRVENAVDQIDALVSGGDFK